MLAHIVRADRAVHPPLPAHSELGQEIAVLPAPSKTPVWERTRAHNRVRSLCLGTQSTFAQSRRSAVGISSYSKTVKATAGLTLSLSVAVGESLMAFITCMDPDTLVNALAKFPTGVTIVTTLDRIGRPWGFTASSFTSLSLNPPQVLICLARNANCYITFSKTDRFAVNILKYKHEPLARRFAAKGVDKFTGGEFLCGDLGLPVLTDALAVLACEVASRIPSGDHTIIIGDVRTARSGYGEPAVYHDRTFRRFADRE